MPGTRAQALAPPHRPEPDETEPDPIIPMVATEAVRQTSAHELSVSCTGEGGEVTAGGYGRKWVSVSLGYSLGTHCTS